MPFKISRLRVSDEINFCKGLGNLKDKTIRKGKKEKNSREFNFSSLMSGAFFKNKKLQKRNNLQH